MSDLPTERLLLEHTTLCDTCYLKYLLTHIQVIIIRYQPLVTHNQKYINKAYE